MQSATPFIVLGRRLGLTAVGYVASWDHTVGKGVIWNGLERYVVQNERMREDLIRYHDVDRGRIVVTGWPQADVFHERRPRRRSTTSCVDTASTRRPVVVVMGNTPTNMPYEGRFFAARRGGPRRARTGVSRSSSGPIRGTREWRERFAAALDRPGAAVQEPSHTDIDVLATILQHADAVVSNAGTILLDALVNDRPAVCVLVDERAGGRGVGREERDRRALPGRRRLWCLPRGSLVRGGRRRHRALPRRAGRACRAAPAR